MADTSPSGSPWQISLIRAYLPSPELNWLAASYDANSLIHAFDDEPLSAEFFRFAYRDLVLTVMSLGFAGAAAIYPILFPDQFVGGYYAIQFIESADMCMCAVISLYLVFYGDFTTSKAFGRSVLAFLMSLGIVSCCNGAVNSFHVRCRGTQNYLALFMPYMSPSDSNFIHDCIRVISGYPFIGMLVNVALVTHHPLVAMAACLWGFFFMYIGYVASADTLSKSGETSTELGLKLLAYLITFIATTIVSIQRYHGLRIAFQTAGEAHAQKLLTKKRSDDVNTLLSAMVPASALERLMGGVVVSDQTDEATVLFSDMAGFTAWSSLRPVSMVVSMLNTLCIQFDFAAVGLGVEKIKTIGDAYWAVTGLPDSRFDHADTMIRFALKMHEIVSQSAARNPEWGTVVLRIGVNSGPLRGAIFGTSRLSYEVFGPTSDIAELCEKGGVPDRVCVSEETARFLSVGYPTEPHKQLEDDGHVINAFLVARTKNGRPIEAESSGSESGDLRVVINSRRGSTYEVNFTPTGGGSTPQGFGTQKAKLNEETKQSDEQRRRKFIERRAARAAELAQQLEDAEVVTARISKRKWSWILLTFDDDATESEFQDWVYNENISLIRTTRTFVAVFIVVQFVIAGADRPSGVPVSTWVLLAICLATALAQVAASALKRLATVDSLAVFVVMCLDAIGCGLVTDNLIGNDVAYIIPVFFGVIVCGVVSIPWIWKLPLIVVFGILPVLYFTYNSILATTIFVYVTFIALPAMLASVSSEKLFRQQFVERRAQTHEHQLQLAREAEQRTLLDAIVPFHVIPPLQRWLEADMNVANTIAQEYEQVSVGFFEVYSTSLASSAANQSDPAGWLFDAHTRIDAAIAAENGTFDKIKTIGNKVMIAGSFTAARGEAADAALAMIRCLRKLREQQLLDIRAGFHVGRVMGAVLGTERLCFDIFGDAVNVASRVLTTQQENEFVTCSSEFVALLRSIDESAVAAECAISAGLPRTAKGKGTIDVFVLSLTKGENSKLAGEGFAGLSSPLASS